jgi:Ca2+-binding RTX toxin-like protein
MVQLFRVDLQFILDQILLAESGGDPPTAFHPWGLRTVDGRRNHLIPGQENWGAADQPFLRLLTPTWRTADALTFDPDGVDGFGQDVGDSTNYLQFRGFVEDADPRIISNLIVDQTPNNFAAVEANGGNPVAESPGLDGIFGTADDTDVFFIANVAPDEGLSAPFNGWFTFFGQFFDHGLDLVNKGGSGTVFVPLQPDDPLFNPAPGAPNFMMLTRATNRAGDDGILGTLDDIHEHNNQTTPFIDQNQTYTSHSSHQVFLREYALNGSGDAVATGRFLDGAEHGGLATWAEIKAQAASMLGLRLSDHDVHNVPLLVADEYGKFTPGANGFAQVEVRVTIVNATTGAFISEVGFTQIEGVAGGLNINALTTANLPGGFALPALGAGQAFSVAPMRTNHAFLDDIAHHAAPGSFDLDGNPATPGRANQVADANFDRDGDGDYDFADLDVDGDSTVTNAEIAANVADVNFDGVVNLADVDRNSDGLLTLVDFDINLDGVVTAADLTADDRSGRTYDNELLDAHFITGDGRGNENIGLTAVHTIFHAEHNRLVGSIQTEVLADLALNGISNFTREWFRLPGETDAAVDARILDGVTDLDWNGERLFQAARVFTEMQYQHLVFEEFARKLQPNIDIFINIDMTINPAIFAEFAHVVYRLGHSMLTETIDRFDPNFNLVGTDGGTDPGMQQIGLIAAFLNPLEFVASGDTAALASGAIIRGMTRQAGNAIDEFVTEALRNNLVGLPLDLAVLNIARGRDTGVPGLNEARRQFYAMTGDSLLTPYTSWVDFAQHVKHPMSVINFIAAYGTHAELLAADVNTVAEKRAVAMALAMGGDAVINAGGVGGTERIFTATEADRLDFLNATGIYAGGDLGGLEGIDLWIGGLAEAAPAFGGMLGSTFAFVFETQMEHLQNGDRFYYLARFSGRNFLAELEGNSFASLIMRNTDLVHLPGDVFSTPNWTLEVNQAAQFTQLGVNNNADPTWADEGLTANPFAPMVSRNNPATPGPDANYLRYNGEGHVVLGGTPGNDTLIASIGDDTIWGDAGNDRIEGGNGVDILNGGDGDDIITDLAFDDNIKGNDGNDVIHSGNGIDLVIGGRGNDFINIGTESGEAFAGLGDDFVTSDGTLIGLVGGFGDDWLEAGFGNSFLTGDNADVDGSVLNFADNDINGGHDVLVNKGGPTDFDSFGGDDIMLGGAGTERYEGFIGFDWGSFQNIGAPGAEADMAIRPVPHPGADPNATLDRFDNTEGLSGSAFNDVLRGDDRRVEAGLEPELTMTGHELNAAGIARITGMADFLGAAGLGVNGVLDGDVVGSDDMFTGGNIILGGAGSDLIEGRGGNDIIDGDAWLHVAIGVDRDNDGDFDGIDINGDDIVDAGSERANWMSDIEAEMLSGALNPGQLGIVREILVSATTDIDTAVYTGNRADYFIEGEGTAEGISDQDGDGFIRVLHFARDAQGNIVPGESGLNGIDLVRNIERLQFNDAVVEIVASTNALPVGAPVISDTTPEEDQVLTVDISGVFDPDNTATNGVITSNVVVTWQQQDGETGLWFDILVPGPNGSEVPIPATGLTFTVGQDQAASAIRVRMTYSDQGGVSETVFSAPTDPVLGINDAPVGALLLSDPTPTVDDTISAQIAFSDADGIHGAVFTFQWESSPTGLDGSWTPIANEVNQTLVVSAGLAGLRVRAVISYVDDFGFDNTLASAGSGPIGSHIVGTAGDDTGATALDGTAFDDLIEGSDGVDTLNGFAGSDRLLGGAGNDTLNGGDGADLLLGGGDDDTLNGGNGNDTLNGGLGNDTVRGNAGSDTFLYTMGDGAGSMNGGPETGAGDIDTVIITGTDAPDILDVRFTGVSLDRIEGGVISNMERVDANLRLGVDTLNYSTTVAAVAVSVNLAIGTASGFTNILGIENVVGGAGNDSLLGDGNANSITGGRGNDTMDGAGGDDLLFASVGGGPVDGDDQVRGGLGFDIYSLGATAAGATVNLGANTASSIDIGTDTLNSIEGVIGSGGGDALTGSSGANFIDGGNGADTINGGDGADTLMGGLGNGDVVNGDGGDDLIIYRFGDGTDISYNGGANNDTLRIDGTTGVNVLGVVYNGAVLTSFNGTTLTSIEVVNTDLGAGNDTLSFANTLAANGVSVDLAAGTASGFGTIAGIENVIGGAGNDTIAGDGAGNNLQGGANGGADVLDGRGGGDTLSGGNGGDTLLGGAGNDTMNGDAGDDIMNGGANNDTMNGGTGNDRFVFAPGSGSDTINGFDADPAGGGQDLLDVSAFAGLTAADIGTRIIIADLGASTRVTIDGVNTFLLVGVNGDLNNVITGSDFIFGP